MVSKISINPALKELQNVFYDLKCELKYACKRGRPIIGYIFTFKPEENKSQKEKKSYERMKTPKNSFYSFDQRTYDHDKLEKELLEKQGQGVDLNEIEDLMNHYKNLVPTD